jgi:hypothetical protein
MSKAASQPKPEPKPQYAPRLDNKPRSLPRGRHAKPRDENDEDAASPPPLGVNQRLGYRISEFAALCGVSLPTVWRGIKADKIDIVVINGVKLVPRSYAIEKGLITKDDAI